MAEQQVIPARHGTATFVPAGQTIKIINTSGTQVVDTWAFALPNPPEPKQSSEEKGQEKKEGAKQEAPKQETPQKKTPAKKGADLPSQEDAEKATQDGMKPGEQEAQNAQNAGQQKNTWSSYVPSIGWSSGKKDQGAKAAGGDTEQQKNSKTWASYFPSGKGFSNYVPKSASDTVSSFAATHQRDPNKSYLDQLQDFSKTPVGAAGWTGISVLSGSGYTSSAYAGYQAWNAKNAANAPQMEFMSMPHSRAAMLHLRPRVNDTLVSNLREPIMTLMEDTSGGVHDTLMAACDPQRYKGLEVENWEEHGSCAENLVLALKELNERAGLKGAKAVGADVTINSVPAPLNLFMNIPWNDEGDISFDAPKSKAEGFVRLKAERDLVIVMSACPQDVLEINGKDPQDAHFLVEDNEPPKEAVKRTQGVRKRPPPRKISSSHATSTVGSQSVAGADSGKKPVPQRRTAPQKKTTGATPAPAQQQSAPSKPASKSSPAPASSGAASAPAKKKPVPKPVQPQKKASAAPAATEEATGSSTAAPPEKKKPRKLTPRPKPQQASAE